MGIDDLAPGLSEQEKQATVRDLLQSRSGVYHEASYETEWAKASRPATSLVLDAVYCSDLQRAVTTARIAFAGRGLPLIPDARLREYEYGALTCFPTAQVEQEVLRRLREPFPGGESLLMVVERVGAFLREVLTQHDGESIVVIGHRATRYGLEYWCGNQTLEEIVHAPWPWLTVPIWRYQLQAHMLNRLDTLHGSW